MNPRVQGKPIKRGEFKPKRHKVVRSGGIPPNPKHQEFIRQLPCILADDSRHICQGRIEAAHCGIGSGMKRKAPDETCLPMCMGLHRTGRYSHHSLPRTFWDHWDLDREMLILEYQARGIMEGTITQEQLDRIKLAA